MIQFSFEDVKFTLSDRLKLKSWIKSVISGYGKKLGDVTYIFCSDDYLLSINRQYLQHDYYTDIITFDYVEDDIISGDLFISFDTVKSNSELFGTTFTDELHRVMIHGVLHLLGLKDKAPEDEEKMRNAENEALFLLNSILSSR